MQAMRTLRLVALAAAVMLFAGCWHEGPPDDTGQSPSGPYQGDDEVVPQAPPPGDAAPDDPPAPGAGG